MKPYLIIGIQFLAIIVALYLTSYLAHILQGHWAGFPTFMICVIMCASVIITIALTINSYLGPKQ